MYHWAKNVAHLITECPLCQLCDRLKMRKKQVCLHSPALCTYEISCRTRIFPWICIRQQSAYNSRQILNLSKTFLVWTLSNSNFVTSLKYILTCVFCILLQSTFHQYFQPIISCKVQLLVLSLQVNTYYIILDAMDCLTSCSINFCYSNKTNSTKNWILWGMLENLKTYSYYDHALYSRNYSVFWIHLL